MIRVGIVAKAQDVTCGGVLSINPIDSKGNLVETAIEAMQCSPNTGDGQGIFTMPGMGSTVLYMDVADAMANLAPYLKTSDIPFKFVWIGAIATSQIIQRKGQSGITNDKNDADDGNNTQKDYLGRDPRKSGLLSDNGVPEAGAVYADNFLPQQDLWKTKNGHKMVMSHKITDKGRHDNSMLMQSAAGKFLRIDDGPPELKMDRIELSDEHKNRFVIKTGGLRPDSCELYTIRDQEQITERGSQCQMIMPASTGTQYRHNYGGGNIEDKACKGNYTLEAEKDITRITANGNISEIAVMGDAEYSTRAGTTSINASEGLNLTCGASTITMTPTSITIDSPHVDITGATGDAVILGKSLVTHYHISPFFGIPTTPPMP